MVVELIDSRAFAVLFHRQFQLFRILKTVLFILEARRKIYETITTHNYLFSIQGPDSFLIVGEESGRNPTRDDVKTTKDLFAFQLKKVGSFVVLTSHVVGFRPISFGDEGRIGLPESTFVRKRHRFGHRYYVFFFPFQYGKPSKEDSSDGFLLYIYM